MSVLMWDKPKKALTVQQWAEHYGFEDGPTGGYLPNMSDSDQMRWKAKITGTKLGYPQVEIRKTAGSQMTLIINLGDGYNYKNYRAEIESRRSKFTLIDQEGTFGKPFHLALNGPMNLTHEEIEEFPLVIAEAKAALNSLMKVKGDRFYYGIVLDSTVTADDLNDHAGMKVVYLGKEDIALVTAPPIALWALREAPFVQSVHLAETVFEKGRELFEQNYNLPDFRNRIRARLAQEPNLI